MEEKPITYHTAYLQDIVQRDAYDERTIRELHKLEQYILLGIKSFNSWWSIFFQWLLIQALQKKHAEQYAAMIKEIWG